MKNRSSLAVIAACLLVLTGLAVGITSYQAWQEWSRKRQAKEAVEEFESLIEKWRAGLRKKTAQQEARIAELRRLNEADRKILEARRAAKERQWQMDWEAGLKRLKEESPEEYERYDFEQRPDWSRTQ